MAAPNLGIDPSLRLSLVMEHVLDWHQSPLNATLKAAPKTVHGLTMESGQNVPRPVVMALDIAREIFTNKLQMEVHNVRDPHQKQRIATLKAAHQVILLV